MIECILCRNKALQHNYTYMFMVDDVVLLAKEVTLLQGMIDRLIEIGRCYRMEINVEKN